VGALLAFEMSLPAAGQSYFNSGNPFQDPVAPSPRSAFQNPGDNYRGGGVPYSPPPMTQGGYNVKLGPVYGNFFSGLSFEYTDNATLLGGGSAEENLWITPSVGGNFRWQVTEQARLLAGVSVGYRFSVLLEDFDQLMVNVGPGSVIDYSFSVGDVRISLFNQLGSSVATTDRPEVAGSTTVNGVRFSRLFNSSGVSAQWVPLKNTSLSVGYSFNLDLGLDDDFSQLDGYSQVVNAAVFQRLGPDWTAGLSGGMAQNDFFENFQNSSQSVFFGPVATWQPSDFLTVSGNVRYNITEFQRDGQIQDTTDATGFSFGLNVNHQLTQRISHRAGGGRAFNLGFGSNFTESWFASYNLNWQLLEYLPISLGANYQIFEQSGGVLTFAPPPGTRGVPGAVPILLTPTGPLFPGDSPLFPAGASVTPNGLITVPNRGESGETLTFILSTGLQLTRQLSSSLSYSHHIRISNTTAQNFSVNTVVLSFNYQF